MRKEKRMKEHAKACPNCFQKVVLLEEEYQRLSPPEKRLYVVYCKKCRNYINESKRIINIANGFLVLKIKLHPREYH